MAISELIDRPDNFELVRDQIAAIIATDSSAQQALATAAAKDPNLWKLRVYTERANPWEQFLDEADQDLDASPIVNVWFDSYAVDQKASDVFSRQATEGTFNIDCYGFALSQSDGAGHLAGDEQAAYAAQRALRLCRSILMAAEHRYLGMQGVVWQRMPTSVDSFQPQQGGQTVQKIVAIRLGLSVKFNEISPQVPAETLDLVSTKINRLSDGQLLVEADYDYTS